MKENEYDNEIFFNKYSKMERSIKGLKGAGEWHELKKLIPRLENKNVLDIGCGFGWHCKYAVEQGANKIVGIDISKKMIEKAKEINNHPKIEYKISSIEDYSYPSETYDVVLSSLALHYIECFDDVCAKVEKTLKENGTFIFSVEHPIFTSNGIQDWIYEKEGTIQHWPVDDYFIERKIQSNFLGETVVKYHKTLTTFINTLIDHRFVINRVIEPMPEEEMLNLIPEMKNELRRPMMLIISATKKKDIISISN